MARMYVLIMNTSTVSKNVSVVRTGLDAFQRADIDTVKGAFTGDILFRQGPSGGTFERVYRGVGSVLAFFADIFTMTGGEFRFETIGLNDCGDDIVAHYCVVHAKRTDGRTVDAEQVQIYHMRHGLIAEIGVYSIDTETFEAFWA